MKNQKNDNTIQDLIHNPTPLSRHIIKMAQTSQHACENRWLPKKFMGKIRFRLLYLNRYADICTFLAQEQGRPVPIDINQCLKRLRAFFDHTAVNNMLLGYAYLTEKDKHNPVITKEDTRLLFFKRFYNDTLSLEEFHAAYGHYGLNAFELAAKRFYEYRPEELKKLAYHLKNFQLSKQIEFDQYMTLKKKNLFAVYSTLREELKYSALKIISQLRVQLLKLQKEKKISNIFQLDYHDLQRQIHCSS